MEDSRIPADSESQLLARMQQLSASLLEQNKQLEGSLSSLAVDAENASTHMSGCLSLARLQQDTKAAAQVRHAQLCSFRDLDFQQWECSLCWPQGSSREASGKADAAGSESKTSQVRRNCPELRAHGAVFLPFRESLPNICHLIRVKLTYHESLPNGLSFDLAQVESRICSGPCTDPPE